MQTPKLKFRIVSHEFPTEPWTRHATLAAACREDLRMRRQKAVPHKVQEFTAAGWVDVVTPPRPQPKEV